MQTHETGEKIPEIEVERLPFPGESAARDGGSPGRSFGTRARAALDPVAAGLLVDLLDLLTLGPLTLLGWVVGVPYGYWLGRRSSLPPRRALLLGLGIAVYCTLPFTAVIPAGTLVGMYLRFQRD